MTERVQRYEQLVLDVDDARPLTHEETMAQLAKCRWELSQARRRTIGRDKVVEFPRRGGRRLAS